MILYIPFFNDGISWFEIICTAIVPVAIFFLGIRFSKILENHKEKTRQYRLIKYFLGLNKQLMIKNKHQAKLLEAAASKNDNFETLDIMPELASGESHVLLNQINREDIYSGLVLSKKSKLTERAILFEKIISINDFLYRTYITIERNIVKIPLTLDRYSTEWNEANL